VNRPLLVALAALLLAAAGALLLLSPGSRHAATPAARPPAPRPASLQKLDASAFTSSYPSGWTLTVKRHDALARYQLSSTGAPINGLGIPPGATVGVTIDETPESALTVLHLAGAKPDRAARKQDAVELMPDVVGVPAGAHGIVHTLAPHPTELAGQSAAEEAYYYTYHGRPNVQVDVLAARGGRVVLVELDAEPRLAATSRSVLEALAAHWRWLQPAA